MDLTTAVVILAAVAAVCLTALLIAGLVVNYLRDRHGVRRRLTSAG